MFGYYTVFVASLLASVSFHAPSSGMLAKRKAVHKHMTKPTETKWLITVGEEHFSSSPTNVSSLFQFSACSAVYLCSWTGRSESRGSGSGTVGSGRFCRHRRRVRGGPEIGFPGPAGCVGYRSSAGLRHVTRFTIRKTFSSTNTAP